MLQFSVSLLPTSVWHVHGKREIPLLLPVFAQEKYIAYNRSAMKTSCFKIISAALLLDAQIVLVVGVSDLFKNQIIQQFRYAFISI